MLLCKFCSTRVLGDIGKPAPDWPNSVLKKSARRPKRKAEEGAHSRQAGESVLRDASTDNAAIWPRSDFFNALLSCAGWAPPLRARALRGKVVLVRWWSDACPMCSGALPSLTGLCTQHRRDGLVILGT